MEQPKAFSKVDRKMFDHLRADINFRPHAPSIGGTGKAFTELLHKGIRPLGQLVSEKG